jgi:hypothetical protein
MKFLHSTLFFFLMTAFAMADTIACRTPTECQVIQGTCGWEVVNKSAAEKTEAENREKANPACVVPGPRPEPDCVSGFCFPKYTGKSDQENDCRDISSQLTKIFSLASKCKEDKDCANSFFEPLYQCRTAFNKSLDASKRLSLLNRFFEHCSSVHKSGFENEDRCHSEGWKSKCKNSKCEAIWDS